MENSHSENAKISDPAVHEGSKQEICTAKMEKNQIPLFIKTQNKKFVQRKCKKKQIPVAQRGIAQIMQIQVCTCENTFVKWVIII